MLAIKVFSLAPSVFKVGQAGPFSSSWKLKACNLLWRSAPIHEDNPSRRSQKSKDEPKELAVGEVELPWQSVRKAEQSTADGVGDKLM